MSKKHIEECVRESLQGYFRDLGGDTPDDMYDMLVLVSENPLLDVVMLSLLEGGRERSAEEFAALLTRAGLELEGVTPTPGPITLFLGTKR